MKRRLFIGTLCFLAALLHAQSPSGINYPLAQCIGGTCPSPSGVKSHITCSFVDSLTETLYTAGQFRTLGSQTRIGIGAINAATGALLSFAPVIDTFGCIYAMGIKGDTLFVGGHFTKVNGVTRNNFAAIRISTGALLPTFNTGIGGVGDTVFAITVYNGRIYVGGKFTTVFGQPRTNIARVNYDGTVNGWNPSVGGVVTKTLQSTTRILVIARVGVLETRLIRIDTASAATLFAIMTTTGSTAPYSQSIQDMVTRADSVYVVGQFYEIDNNTSYQQYVVSCMTTGVERHGIAIPIEDQLWTANRLSIEFYRDSVYIGVYNGFSRNPLYHRLYVAHYKGSALRVVKIYNSQIPSTNDGKFCEDLLISNARMFEVERYADHTSNPYGSYSCAIFSWCMKIPSQPGNWLAAPDSICPGDTFWLVVQDNHMYATYNWFTGSPNTTLFPAGDSCRVVTTAAFTFCNVNVRGVTSCGIQNGTGRSKNIYDKIAPLVSAGPDDSLSCIVTQTTLHATYSTFPANNPVSWAWSPNVFSAADSCVITIPGMYYVTCTGANGCHKTDSAFVFADTIPPVIVPFGPMPVITCANPSVTLDASSVYPVDSLQWIIGAGSFADPATTSVPGNVLLVVTDRRNGCSSTDTLTILQNITAPVVSAIYTDSTLTCSVDSILLTGYSSDPDVIFHWENSQGDSFPDPMYADTIDVYGVYGIDTSNGCSAGPSIVIVSGWYTPPSVSAATDSFNINCSYDSVQLGGSSLTLAATLQWTDSISFYAANPVMTGTQGMYYLIATDTLNGCVAVDSAYVGFQATLDVAGVNDTVICPGSGAVLNVVPIGGTPSFSYQWNNSAGTTALVTVYPADTLQYIVTVTDGAGCSGEDTVIVNVPDAIMDSVLSFQPCDPLQPTGQIQIYPWGGVPPYQFSGDNGLTWQTSGVFGSLAYGSYQFLIQDAIGCTLSAAGNIDTNSLSPAPEFLVSTSPELGDTIVIVDISNPRPDSVVWDFPPGTTIIDTSMFSPSIIPADTGAFDVSMHAFYGTCEVILTRTVNIQPFDSLNAQPWAMNAIDSLILYPNPNSGTFTVHAELEGKQDFVVLVLDELGNERARTLVSEADEWTGQMSVSNPVPGNYILRVIAEYDSAEMVFVISQ